MRVKICGITLMDDAEHAVTAGAWAIGLNHWVRSPRRCDPNVAAEIGATLRRSTEVVGVFVNPTLDEVVHAAEDAQLTIVQLHGDEGPSFCATVARRTGCRVIKALRVRGGADLQAAAAYRTDLTLLDGYAAGQPGGTGKPFDWGLLRERRPATPFLLAGGLTADNVGGAIAETTPYAVDVASGVESEPGRKDPALVDAFIEAANAAIPATSAEAL